jgi:hypothetical protein
MVKTPGWVAAVGLILGCATASPPPQNASAAAPSTQTQAVAADSGGQKAAGSGTAVAKNDKDKLVCTSEQVTGSRIPKRVCRTQEQIDRERESAQKALRESERVNRNWND